MNRKDWRTISVEDVDYDVLELARQLGPTLRARQPGEQASLEEYGAQLLGETRRSLSALLPFTDAEQAFLDLLLDKGEIDATILTSDSSLQKRIQVQRFWNGRPSMCVATRDCPEMMTNSIGILAYGSLIHEPGCEIAPAIIRQIFCRTPFKVEYARKSNSRNGAPTLVPDNRGTKVTAQILVVDLTLCEAKDCLYSS